MPGVSGIELDDIGSINTFSGSADSVSVGSLASGWSFGAWTSSESISMSSGSSSENLNSFIGRSESNAGTVVLSVDSLVEDGESWVVWAGLGSTFSEFLNRDTVFVPRVDQSSSLWTAWTVVEIDTVLGALLVDSLSKGSVLGMKLPAVAISPDVTGDEILDSVNSEHK